MREQTKEFISHTIICSHCQATSFRVREGVWRMTLICRNCGREHVVYIR